MDEGEKGKGDRGTGKGERDDGDQHVPVPAARLQRVGANFPVGRCHCVEPTPREKKAVESECGSCQLHLDGMQ